MRKTVIGGIAFVLSFILMACGMNETKIGERSHVEQVNTMDGVTVSAIPEVYSTEHPKITIILQNDTTKPCCYDDYPGVGGLEIEQDGNWHQIVPIEAPPRTEILQTILAGQTLEVELDFARYGTQIPTGRYRYVFACWYESANTHYVAAEFVLE